MSRRNHRVVGDDPRCYGVGLHSLLILIYCYLGLRILRDYLPGEVVCNDHRYGNRETENDFDSATLPTILRGKHEDWDSVHVNNRYSFLWVVTTR